MTIKRFTTAILFFKQTELRHTKTKYAKYTICNEHCSVGNFFSTSKLIKLFCGELNHIIIFEYV